MTAPAAPAIFARYDGNKARVRWAPVSTATYYKVKVDATSILTVLAAALGADGWFVQNVVAGPNTSVTVTAWNVADEESAASNAFAIGHVGDMKSFPPTAPADSSVRRGPFG